MHAIEEKENLYSKPDKEDHELTIVKSSARLFKVVVNNYKQEKEEISEEPVEDIDATMNFRQIGLPPQPTNYLKYPSYDWF
jgi:hypothetical protein